ncbi:hypothetical protein ACLK17_17065 [Escherichia coli]
MQELIDYIGQSHYDPGDEALNCDESEGKGKSASYLPRYPDAV